MPDISDKSKAFWTGVLNMVRLLAMYFGLYVLLLWIIGGAFFKDNPSLAGIFALGGSGLITLICLPKDHKKISFACSNKALKLLGIIFLSLGLTLLFNRVMDFIPWNTFLPDSLKLPETKNFEIPVWLALFGYGFLVPLSEEVCFRGILYTYFAKWMKVPVAVLLSALLFALYHLNLVQGIYAFFMGAVMALLIHKTKALSASLVFHMTSNLLVTVYAYHKPLYDFLASKPGLFLAAGATAAGAALLLTGKKEKSK